VSSGLLGGWKKVNHIFNHTVDEKAFDLHNPVDYLKDVAAKYGFEEYFGLLTAVPMKNLTVVRKGDVLVFATAGVNNPNSRIGTINIIVVVDAMVSDGGMINGIITATEAKSAELISRKHNFTGTNTDAVIIAQIETKKSGRKYYEYAGPASELGVKIWNGVREAVGKSLAKWYGD
jgi:adenosylcobinamide hydrolase